MTGTFFRWFFGSSAVMIAGVMLLASPWLVLKIVAVIIAIPLAVAAGGFVWGLLQALDAKRGGR